MEAWSAFSFGRDPSQKALGISAAGSRFAHARKAPQVKPRRADGTARESVWERTTYLINPSRPQLAHSEPLLLENPDSEAVAQSELHDARLVQGLVVFSERSGYVQEADCTGWAACGRVKPKARRIGHVVDFPVELKSL